MDAIAFALEGHPREYDSKTEAIAFEVSVVRWTGRTPAAALFWRLFLLNGLVFVAGAGVLVLSPATVSSPVSIREVSVLTVGLALMLAVNALLLKASLRPMPLRL